MNDRCTLRRLSRLSALAGLSAAVLAPSAAAADRTQLLKETVAVGAADSRACQAGVVPGAAQRTVTMPSAGIVSARLTAAGGDWDLAIFDSQTRRAVGASAGFGASELASGFAGAGRPLIVQACRRSGSARTASIEVVAVDVPAGDVTSKPSLVDVTTRTPADKDRLSRLGLDLTEHAGPGFVEVVAYGPADLAKLRSAGFEFKVEVDDLVKTAQLNRAADRAFAAATRRSALPSGRTEYRRLGDYQTELKTLAERYPSLVKPITLKHKTTEGREVTGIEITQNASNVSDGKPVFFQMGVHHAREWPSGEHAMEFAYELLNGYGGNQRITNLVNRVRVIVVPIINPDGFNLSREAPVDLVEDPEFAPFKEELATPAYLADPAFAYKRRNCRIVPGQQTPMGVCGLPQNRTAGVDPNRNYGGFWGGPGASAFPVYDTYRGPGPFSEPETQNVRDLVASRQVTTLITNHTFSNLVLRPPGVRAQGPPADEGIYADLGARMAAQNGYTNQPSYNLYDTTGGTEDWTYYATGGLGFTFEIGPDNPQEGGFHPQYQFTAKQYEQGSNGAGGNREAYLIAMENAADASKHSTLTGEAPGQAILRLRKEFVTETSPVRPAEDDVVSAVPVEGPKQQFDDVLDSTLDVPSDGKFTWSVNPSTRPILETRVLPTVAAEPSRKATFEPEGQTTPNQLAGEGEEGTFEDIPLKVTAEDATKVLEINLTGSIRADDYDLELYRKDGETLTEVGSSGNPANPEAIFVEEPRPADYVLRVVNYLAFGPWEVTVEWFQAGPNKVEAGKKEAWTLTCETPDGKVIASQKVQVDRSQKLDLGEPCGANAREIIRNEVAGKKATPACATTAGFRTARVRATGRTATFDFTRRLAQPVTVEVFQTSLGSKVVGNRLVARFRGLSEAYRWDGRGRDGRRVRDGHLFVRYSVKGIGGRTDVRRSTLVRRKGRFSVKPTFYRRANCDLLGSFKLERPVFGGSANRSLGISYRLAKRSDVVLTITRGKRQIRRVVSRNVRSGRTVRSRLRSRGLPKGDYRVRIAVTSGGRTVRSVLVSRRL